MRRPTLAKTSFAFPKPQYWQEFEDLTHQVFKVAFNDATPTKHGRSGQQQYGVDVFGRLGGRGDIVAIQCKRRESADVSGPFPFGHALTRTDITDEVEKVDPDKLAPAQLIIATTAPADGEIQRWVEEYNEERWNNDRDAFRVSVWHWQDYEAYLNGDTELQKWYFREVIDHFGKERAEKHILTLLRDAFSRPAFRDPLHNENARNFREAIRHTQQAVDLGVLVDRITGLTIRKAIGGVTQLSDTDAKSIGRKLSQVITKLSNTYDTALIEPYTEQPAWNVTRLTQQDGMLIINDHKIGEKLNGYRRQAIELVNQLLEQAELGQIESPSF